MTPAERNQYKTRSDFAADIDSLDYQIEKMETKLRIIKEALAQLEQQLADLGNGTLSERQIARYPVVGNSPLVKLAPTYRNECAPATVAKLEASP